MSGDIDIKEQREIEAEKAFVTDVDEKISKVSQFFPDAERKRVDSMLSVDPSFMLKEMLDCDQNNLERTLLHFTGYLDMADQVRQLAKKVAPKEEREEFIENVDDAISDLDMTVMSRVSRLFMAKCIIKGDYPVNASKFWANKNKIES
jgi:hypothetical protein